MKKLTFAKLDSSHASSTAGQCQCELNLIRCVKTKLVLLFRSFGIIKHCVFTAPPDFREENVNIVQSFVLTIQCSMFA